MPQPAPGAEIAREPDQPAAARGAGAPPLGERPQHRLAGRDAAEREIALRVARAQVGRHATPKSSSHVVIADVLEVPVRAGVAWHARPSSAGDAPGAAPSRSTSVDRRGVGHVGEREALGGEPDARAARIVERPAVRAHAVVVT